MADITSIFGGSFVPPIQKTPDAPEVQFLDAIVSSGIEPDLQHIILDGNVHRFNTQGRKGKTGWYVGFADGVAAGRFGCWRQGVEISWRAETEHELNAAEQMALMRRMEEAKKKRDAERAKQQELAADIVETIWSQAQAADDSHPYLERKGIASHGARVTGDGRLVVPLYDKHGELISLQYISHSGDKQYHSKGKTQGGFHVIGDLETDGVLYLAEGFATAATIHEETGQPCVASYSASNLVPVAEAMREKYPNRRMVIIADNDEGGIGQAKAEQACALTGATYALPPQVGMDANDWIQAGGSIEDIIGRKPEAWLEKITADWISQPAPLKWLIKGWIPEQCLGMLHGPSGGGKSFILIDMMLHLATGKQWQGKSTKKGCIVYLAGEGNYGMRSRVAAWVQQNHKQGGDIDMFISKSGCDLNTAEGYNHAMMYLQEVAREHEIVAVCVDTLHRFLHGDENSAQDAKTMIDACDAIKRNLKTSVWLVHHTGLSEGAQDRARGSSAWRGALDVELGLRPPSEKKEGAIIQHKMKDAEQAAPLRFSLKSVPIDGWFDEEGEQVMGAVVDWGEEEEPSKKLTPHDKAVIAFEKAFNAFGEVKGGYAVLTEAAWLRFLEKDEPDKNHKKKLTKGNTAPSQYLGYLHSVGLLEETEIPTEWRFTDSALIPGAISAKTLAK